MMPTLFVLSREPELQEAARARLSPLTRLIVADSLLSLEKQLDHAPHAGIVCLSEALLDQQPISEFLARLTATCDPRSTVGLIGWACPPELGAAAAGILRECLPMPHEPQQIDNTLEHFAREALDPGSRSLYATFRRFREANGQAGIPTLEERVDQFEKWVIEESLQRHNHHRGRTARELGISRVTLYNKMKKFGMLS